MTGAELQATTWLDYVNSGSVLGLLALILYFMKWALPKLLAERRKDHEEERAAESERLAAQMQLYGTFADRMAAAQEKQADAVCQLALTMERHDGDTTARIDGVGLAVSVVDQKVDRVLHTIERKIASEEGE